MSIPPEHTTPTAEHSTPPRQLTEGTKPPWQQHDFYSLFNCSWCPLHRNTPDQLNARTHGGGHYLNSLTQQLRCAIRSEEGSHKGQRSSWRTLLLPTNRIRLFQTLIESRARDRCTCPCIWVHYNELEFPLNCVWHPCCRPLRWEPEKLGYGRPKTTYTKFHFGAILNKFTTPQITLIINAAEFTV